MTVFDIIAIGVFIAAIMLFWLFLDKNNECRALRRRCKEEKRQYEEAIAKTILEYDLLCSGVDEFIVLSDNKPSVRIIGLKRGTFRSVVIKEFPFNPDDPDDRDFAVRNAKELIEEIKKA